MITVVPILAQKSFDFHFMFQEELEHILFGISCAISAWILRELVWWYLEELGHPLFLGGRRYCSRLKAHQR